MSTIYSRLSTILWSALGPQGRRKGVSLCGFVSTREQFIKKERSVSYLERKNKDKTNLTHCF